jgi:hypothetical protein
MKAKVIFSVLVAMFLLAGCSEDESDTGTNPNSAPDIPTGLTVTHIGLANMTLSWDASSGATDYNLYRSESETGTYHLVYSGELTEFNNANLVWVTTYYYRVTAENSTGESDPCTPVNGTTGTPVGFVVSGSPSGAVDYTFNYLDDFNGKPRYQSDPIGLWIVVPTGGDQAGLWCFYDQIEGMNLYYNSVVSDYPSPSGYYTVIGDSRTTIILTPF